MKSSFKKFVFFAFTLSGAFGLVYEVLWQRQLSLIFGATLPATTAVLTAFMAGLAIGSHIFGKISGKVRRPFQVFGLLQIGIGVYCLAMPLIFKTLLSIHIFIYNRYGGSFQLEALRFILAIVVLLVPCALMGGTLPILSKGLIKDAIFLGKSLSLLYFFNTIGAAIGTLTTGFFLIKHFGMMSSNSGTAVASILLGLMVYFLSRNVPEFAPEASMDGAERSTSKRIISLLPILYAFTGAAAMGTQIAWTRSLNLVLGSTVYAFSLMLGSFLLGIALGSLFMGRFMDKKASPVAIVGVLSILVCISIAFSIALISHLPVVLLYLFPGFHSNFLLWQICLFSLSLIVVFPATFFLGALFPAFGKAYVSQISKVGEQIGNLYLWNTMGGIVGSIACGFLLIPSFGTRLSLLIFSSVFLVVGTGLLLFSTNINRIRIQIVILLLVCIFGFRAIPKWEPALLDSGVYIYAPQLVNGFESNRTILFEEEGYHSHVSVSQRGSIRSLRINGKTDGSDGGDLATQALLAILPLAHIEHPKDALIIGLGTGVTAGSALNFDTVHVSCVEIDDAVISAAEFFNHVSGNPFSYSRFKVLHADARTVLGSGSGNYDAIISEPSNPWITGVSNLFTVEYFQSALNKLTEKGIMCQWIHSYYMDTETLMILFRSFQSVFPFCSLWEGSPGDYLILGSKTNIVRLLPDYGFLFKKQNVQKDLMRLDIQTSSDISDRFILGPIQFKTMTEKTGFRTNTDDMPYVEFNAPMSLYCDTVADNAKLIRLFQDKQRLPIK